MRHGPERLLPRLADNERVLLHTYGLVCRAVERGRRIAPAAEWLLDNFHLVEQQVRMARLHLPRAYSRRLPRLAQGRMAGQPRVYHLAEELIAHVDGRLDAENLSVFVAAYQSISPLNLGELWAVPIMLRLALIENLRRVAARIALRREQRDRALQWANRLLAEAERRPEELIQELAALARSNPPFTHAFLEELYRPLQGHGSSVAFVLSWFEHRLSEQGLTFEQLQRADSQTQAADQVSIGNSIGSLRFLGAMNWREFVETMSTTELELRHDPADVYSDMDFASRDRYRHRVEEIAWRAKRPEPLVAQMAVALAAHARATDGPRTIAGHIGYWLVGDGNPQLRREVGAPDAMRRWFGRVAREGAVPGYVGLILLLTAGLAVWLLPLLPFASGWGDWRFWLLLAAVVTAVSQFAVALTNQLATWLLQPRVLPRLDFKDGIPADQRTMVVIPTLLTSSKGVARLLERIEIHFLGNRDPNLFFGLLTDFADAPEETMPADAGLLEQARTGIAALNTKYAEDGRSVFYLFHRPRLWNPHERLWMGWERKRGKLEQFNALLRGKADGVFSTVVGDVTQLRTVRYVITLDTDTQLPRDTARRLVGLMAHPLNAPHFDAARRRVVSGYTILQPRVSISLTCAAKSRFAQFSAGETGIDPYTREVSDVYQDWFGEGSFVGKGIYDVDAFRATLEQRFPENLILSHDLIESGYARSALVSNVELFEEAPTTYPGEASRRHRWIRGDWQIAPWLLPCVPGATGWQRNRLPGLARWKILDNLRRALIPPAWLVLLLAAWLLGLGAPGLWTSVAIALALGPAVLSAVPNLLRKSRELGWRLHVLTVMQTTGRHLTQAAWGLIFLPYDALICLDAFLRSAVRMLFTRRGLFLWHTHYYARRNARRTPTEFADEMWIGPFAGIGAAVALWWFNRPELFASAPLLALWAASPLVAWWLSRPTRPLRPVLSAAERSLLSDTAHRTWDYFERFVNADENWLPPDNFQEDPGPIIASRTSPTNIGLSLLANLAAYDFGYIDRDTFLTRTENTLGAMQKLERFRGHFYNWYDTRSLKVLPPHYVSSVDSGNLLGALRTLRAGLLELPLTPTLSPRRGEGDGGSSPHRGEGTGEGASLTDLARQGDAAATAEIHRIEQLAEVCDELGEMDFRFLYDPAQKLLAIGYNVAERRRDPSYYDLLASEARLASFILIAEGQLPQEHWFALGRLLTRHDGALVLLSWSGSMFEYLMPELLMPSYPGTLLDQACRGMLERQIEYGRQRNTPWGISESCYNVTDLHHNYQYRAFGVPGLGFKRGLADDLVIAPYATLLAAPLAPTAVCKNLRALATLGAEGQFGFYEALDFTPARVPRGQKHALIKCYMAHHQGMGLLALAHALLDAPMQRRFLADPLMRATELLLQERLPKATPVLQPHAPEVTAAARPAGEAPAAMRVFQTADTALPETQLLSNGRYHVMATNAGGGYSRWRDLAVTRWREDGSSDWPGMCCYLRDRHRGAFWSTSFLPTRQAGDRFEAIFLQARVEYRLRRFDLDSHTEICVSPEDDVEVRRVTLTNLEGKERELDVTSYGEVVLAPLATDIAHRAFSNLFVQTEVLSGMATILCTRRARTADEAPPWLFHVMTVQGAAKGSVSFETDRARFIGRGRDLAQPAALTETADLGNTRGAVLDPVVAIRRVLMLAADAKATVHIVTGMAETRAAAVALAEKYRDPRFADRAFEMAWSHNQVVLRHLDVNETDAQLYERLAGSVLQPLPLLRAPASVLARNRRGQHGLWPYAVSGDLPIVLVRISDINRLSVVKQVLHAHAYWRTKGLAADLVILNEDFSGYRQALQDAIAGLINSAGATPLVDRPGGVFVRRGEQLNEEDRVLFQAAARVVLTDSAETLAEQLERRLPAERHAPRFEPTRAEISEPVVVEPKPRERIFFNGLGGFTPDGREYIITLTAGQNTPAPWVNVIANPVIGTVVSETGSAYTWVENAHEFRLTPWLNDPVSDPTGEAFYLRDEETGRFWSPTPLPARCASTYTARHGFGYSAFELTHAGIASELLTYVAVDSPVKLVRLKVRNVSNRPRQLSVTGYWELVLGDTRERNAAHIVTELDPHTGALLARNCWQRAFADRVVFAAVNDPARTFTTSRAEFLGRNGTLAAPAALKRAHLAGRVGAGLDPCAALQARAELRPGEEREFVFVFGAGRGVGDAQRLLRRFGGAAGAQAALEAAWQQWNRLLGAVHVETPDPAFNVLANGWLVYQTIACRYWGRSGYYQSGGAFGFRDQLQDTVALLHPTPWLTREQLLRAAAHQFRQGDVQHWWHPPDDRGVRTHFRDDYLWLPYAAGLYVAATGDTGVLDERLPFLEGRPVNPEEEAYYDQPQRSAEAASLYEHCLRAVKHGLRFGAHGLPLMGGGDWNDGMNLIGQHGKGESVWLAFFLFDVLNRFPTLAEKRGDTATAQLCREQAAALRANIEQHGWDGAWYRRAYFDDGTPLGSALNEECKIDSIAQSWAVLSGAAPADRARLAMEEVNDRLVRRDLELIQLFDPPFDKSALQPGYIKGYVPGVRENGGQYTHGALWAVMAFAQLGDAARAWELWQLLNPIRHANSAPRAQVYKVEPYVMAADVYATPQHAGRGGWTWYTGSAGWTYRLLIETFLGLRLAVDKLTLAPCLPPDWPGCKIHYRYRDTFFHLNVTRATPAGQKVTQMSVDGTDQPNLVIALVDDHQEHQVDVTLG